MSLVPGPVDLQGGRLRDPEPPEGHERQQAKDHTRQAPLVVPRESELAAALGQ